MATTFDPFREIERYFSNAARVPSAAAMPMDLYRDGDVYYVNIDLPGVDANSIDIDVEDRTLTIRAERKLAPTGEDHEWLTRERPTGTFARQLTLGSGLASDRIEASYTDGVLTLSIPVSEAAKPRKISVSHTGASNQIEATGE